MVISMSHHLFTPAQISKNFFLKKRKVFTQPLVTDGELDKSMRITAVRDADNKPKVVKAKE